MARTRRESVKKCKKFQKFLKLRYTDKDLELALADIGKGVPILSASKTYKIPYATLHDKINGKSARKKQNSGFNSYIGEEKESILVNWIIGCGKMGFPQNKNSLLDSVRKIVNKSNIKTPFKDGRPGQTWFQSFMKRHPILSQKKSEYVNKARGLVTEAKIRSWFEEISILLGPDIEVLHHPRRIFNLDETAFNLAPNGDLVLCEKGKQVYDESQNNSKENITTLFTVNATGEFAPPLTIYKYARIPTAVSEAAPTGWGIGRTESGWMTSEAFYEYIANVFLPFLRKHSIQFPVIVFMDGHSSHLSFELSKFCKENKIILIALYPNSTHILQPLDVAVFGPMKKMWRTIKRQFRIDNDGREMKKIDIPNCLNKFIVENSMRENIKSGFKCTGLYPFNVDEVDFSKIVLRDPPTVSITTNSQNHLPDHQNRANFTDMDGIKFVENNINPNILQEFKMANELNNGWQGDIKWLELFNFWVKISGSRKSSTIENIVEPPSIIIKENIMPNLQDAMQDIIRWPQQPPLSTSKRTRSKMPSVLTSDKWMEISVAKETEKNAKEAAKKLKQVSKLKKILRAKK